MVFWRRKKNTSTQEQQDADDQLLHPEGEPAIEPSTDENVSEPSKDQIKSIQPKETDLVEELVTEPVPEHTPIEDSIENDELSDHTDEGGWLSRLASGLKKSSQKISDVLTKRKLDDEALEELEEALITADLGPKTAMAIIKDFSAERFGAEVTEDEIKQALAESMTKILEPVAKPLYLRMDTKPNVILMTGVNGAGKTTTIGKMAAQFQKDGKKVMIAAADTFRAAAVEQIKVWGERNNCPVIAKDVGADPASVAFEAVEQAKKDNVDVLLIDTAGRLHNKKNLMEELQKIVRVIKKQDDNAPHATLLVLDSTTGQNAIAQVETFKDLIDVSGLIVTKLDGSAKGGIVVALADQFGLPVHSVGVGEGIEDLQPFTAESYARSLIGLNE